VILKYFKLFIILILFSAKLFSQLGPGYMGKRFVAGYGFYFSPAFIGSNASESSIIGRGNAVGGDIAFNSMHEGFLEFAFKKRASVGLSFKYYKTTYDNSAAALVNVDYGGYTNSESASPMGFSQITGSNYTLYFKIFNKRYVAPWGRYLLFGPTINSFKCSYDPTTMKIVIPDNYGSGGNIVINDFGPQGQQFLRGDLLVGWGRSRIFANRITLDYGINVQLISLTFTLWDAVGANALGISRTTNYNYFENTSKRRVREVNRVNAFIKIGLLLF
jgi:hypothetical protein